MKNMLKMALVVVSLGVANNSECNAQTASAAAVSCKAASQEDLAATNSKCDTACKSGGAISGQCQGASCQCSYTADIKSAMYGDCTVETSPSCSDVTSAIKTLLTNKRNTGSGYAIVSISDFINTDPAFGVVKWLEIKFSKKDSNNMMGYRFEEVDFPIMLLTQWADTITSAHYGDCSSAQTPSCRDVTNTAKTNIGKSNFNESSFGSDPAYGVVKTLEIKFNKNSANKNTKRVDTSSSFTIPSINN